MPIDISNISNISNNGKLTATVTVTDPPSAGNHRASRIVNLRDADDVEEFLSDVECGFGSAIAGDARTAIEAQASCPIPPTSNGNRTPPSPTQPIPLDSPKPPPLPQGVFDRWWYGDMIQAVSGNTETPPELAVAFTLAVLATVLQQRFKVRVRPDYFEPLNLWPMCVLPPGARKSGVSKPMMEPLSEWENVKRAELLPQIEQATSERKTIEARIARLRSDAAKGKADIKSVVREIETLEAQAPKIPRVPQLYSQDITPEHLGTMLAENGERMSLLADEAGIFGIMGGRYSNGMANLDVFLQAHAGTPVRVNRGSRPPVFLNHPALTIGISPQPEVLRGLTANRDFRGRGLLARFLYLVPTSNLGYRADATTAIPDQVKNKYREQIICLANIEPDMSGGRAVPRTLYFTKEALAVWRTFWQEVEVAMRPGGRLEHLTDWAGKLPGAVARVAGLLHCAKSAGILPNAPDIEAETVQDAVEFGRCLIGHALIAFDMMGADPAMEAARDLWKQIEKAREPVFTLRDAWQNTRGRYKTVKAVEPGIDVLIDHGWITEPAQGEDGAPRRAGRKPSRQFHVNPLIAEQWQ